MKKVANNKKRNLQTPAKLHAPVSKTTPERLKVTLQGQRLTCSQFEELAVNSVEIDKEFSADFVSILDRNDVEMTPFMKLFWGEQKKMFSVSSKGARYHPMIIRFCLSVQSKSSSAYKEWTDVLGKKKGEVLTYLAKEH